MGGTGDRTCSGMADLTLPRVLIADDHSGLLTALERLLAPSCAVVGLISEGADVVDAAIRLRPDVIVLDLNIRSVNGLELCQQLKEAVPATRIVMMTTADDDALRRRAFVVGAYAFVLKWRVADELLGIIQEACHAE